MQGTFAHSKLVYSLIIQQRRILNFPIWEGKKMIIIIIIVIIVIITIIIILFVFFILFNACYLNAMSFVITNYTVNRKKH